MNAEIAISRGGMIRSLPKAIRRKLNVCQLPDVKFMSQSSELSNPRLDHILHTLIEHRKLWLVPGIAALMMSWFYVYFIRSDTYTARQTLIVRDDLLGQSLKPGQFESLDLMKSAQETILEIARKPQVVRNAMRKIGPARVGWFGVSDDWPSDKTIEQVQGAITLSAPNGAEFGHTETVVLSTKSSSRERAAQFVLALLEEINVKINEVRDLRLRSMKNELTTIRDSALESLTVSAERLTAMEREIGPDLPTLRALSDPQSGEGTMSQTLLQIRSERRQFENKLHSARNQRETLVAATHDPNAILATSDELFSFQPALSRLKQELIEAQSALAASVGRYEQAHPEVQKYQEQVRTMHQQIHDELDSAKRGLESQIASLEEKVAKSSAQEAEIDSRFNKISSKRVDYLRLDEEVKKKSEVFNEAQGNLASIERLDSEQFDVTLLTPVDEPQVSTRADGLGRTTTILGSGVAGLLAGFGLVLLLAPGPDQDLSRRGATGRIPPQPRTDVPKAPVSSRPATQPAHKPIPSSVTGAPGSTTATHDLQNSPPVTAVGSPAVAESSKTGSTTARQPVVKNQQSASAPNTPLTPTLRKKRGSDAIAKPQAAQVVNEQFLNRADAIQTEIEKVIAESSGAAPTQVTKHTRSTAPKPAAPRSTAQAPATEPDPPMASGTAELQPQKSAQTAQLNSPADGKATEFAQSSGAVRRQSDSTGVPTAASILAALDKVAPPVGNASDAVIKPQQTDTKSASTTSDLVRPMQKVSDFKALAEPAAKAESSIPTVSTPPSSESVQIESSSPVLSSHERELELRRRVSQRPLDIAQQSNDGAPAKQAIPFVSLEPDVARGSNQPDSSDTADPSGKERGTNPFLNPGQSSNDAPPANTQRMLDEAKAAAESQGMVTPVAPVKPNAETTQSGRMPAATVPIPDQIKQLTDSIASFAKPIERIKDSGKNTDF